MKSSKLTTQSECFTSYGKNIHFNRMRAFNNRAIGFYFVGTISYNIAYRCDAFNNIRLDSATLGNCDGFGAHGILVQNSLNVEHGITVMVIMIV